MYLHLTDPQQSQVGEIGERGKRNKETSPLSVYRIVACQLRREIKI